MFYDHVMSSLYSIRCNDYRSTHISDEHIMRFPPNMGLTGEAIANKGPVISELGEEDVRYSFEVDNIHQILDVNNILILPLIDSDGKL